MEIQQKGVIALIKSAIEDRAYPLPDAFDMEIAAKIAYRHKVIALVYYGAVRCGINPKSEVMQKLFRHLVSVFIVSEKQSSEHNRLLAAFEEHHIDHMPMKGLLLRTIYPKQEMRTMGDADILVRLEQYDNIQKIMQDLGYTFLRENDHELAWQREGVEIELHKRMIPSHNEDLYAYFGDGWGFAKKNDPESTRYSLSNEDFYIHIFAHMTKHYRSAGIGIKHLVDIWVYRNAVPAMDEVYITQALRKLGLFEFHKNILQTIDVWFADGNPSAVTDCITAVFFESGEFGLPNNREIGRILKESKKAGSVQKVNRKEFWSAVFLPYEAMCEKYLLLRKVAVLLPIMWIVRCFDVFFFNRQKLKKFFGRDSVRNQKKIDERKKVLNFVGLDIGA